MKKKTFFDPPKKYMMTKTSLFTASLIFLFLSGYTQSTIKKIRVNRNNKTYQVFKIDTMKVAKNDGKYERALSQSDIIGNDFYGVQKISMARNKNEDGSQTPTNYIPVDGHKRTFCGAASNYFYKDGTFDKDHCIYIDVLPGNDLLNGKINLYNQYGNFEKPWNSIEGEINIHSSNRKYYDPPFSIPDTRFTSSNKVCMYGPWVLEIFNKEKLEKYDVLDLHKDHQNNNEIHPMEQFWWKERPVNRNAVFYNMALAVDNSGRFNDIGDYYAIENRNTFKPWSINPLDGVFAIAFEAQLGMKKKIIYGIYDESNKYAGILTNDGKKHFLVYKNDTLVEINENTNKEILNIDFVNVGYEPIKLVINNKKTPIKVEPDRKKLAKQNEKTTIRGFILIKCKIAGLDTVISSFRFTDYAGNLKLSVDKNITSTSKTQVKITLEKIKRMELNSYGGVNEFTHQPMSRFHPLQAAPGFDENGVDIKFRIGTNNFPTIRIQKLEKNQEFTFNNVSLTWEGLVTDNYASFIDCSIPGTEFPLGELQIGGDPLLGRNDSWQTVLPVQRGDMQSQNVRVFEFTFKVEAIAIQEAVHNTNRR